MRTVIPTIDRRRGMTVAPAAAGSGREDRRHLADALRGAVGFRIDGPEGRVGVRSGAAAGGVLARPERERVFAVGR